MHEIKAVARKRRGAGLTFGNLHDLIAHRHRCVTFRNAADELRRLIEAAERVCDQSQQRAPMVILRRQSAA